MSQDITQWASSQYVVAWEGLASLPRVGRMATLARKEHDIIGLVLSGMEVVGINPDSLECLYAGWSVSLFAHRTNSLRTCDLYTDGACSPFGSASCQ